MSEDKDIKNEDSKTRHAEEAPAPITDSPDDKSKEPEKGDAPQQETAEVAAPNDEKTGSRKTRTAQADSDSTKAEKAPTKKKTVEKATSKTGAPKKKAVEKAVSKKEPSKKTEETDAAKTEPARTEESPETAASEAVPVSSPPVHFESKDEIGFVVFDTPGKPVNIFNESMLRTLSEILDELLLNTEIKALLFLSAKPGNFVAGADIAMIRDITDVEKGKEGAEIGHAIFGKIAALPYPTCAVIDGVCLGGGLELSLACTYRIARNTAATKIGLPEVQLGIIPGWGGTQRLPRLIGIQKALDLILTGKRIDAKRAYRMGLVDQIIPDEFPEGYTREAALKFTSEMLTAAGKARILKRREKKNLQTVLLEKNALGRKVLFNQARKKTSKASKGHYPSPLKALEAVEKGMNTDLRSGLEIEAKLLGECIVSTVCKNLIHVFLLMEANKKDTGSAAFEGDVQTFKKVGVLGAGIMGGGIAQVLAYNGISVRMKDLNWQAVGAGLKQASKIFTAAAKRRKLKPAEAKKKFGLISGAVDFSGFESSDMVIEAIVENQDVKKKAFAELDGIVQKDALLVSNTSSLSVTEMAAATSRPEQVAGLHFFNPVHKMPLVEIIQGKSSSARTIASLLAFSRKIGKTPIVVKDSAGFLVNRILSPYMNEAALLLQEGQKMDHIDQVLRAFGMPMGPLQLFDEVGIDVAHKVSGILEHAFGDRVKASPVIEKMFEAGRLGKKGGAGFYKYKGRDGKPDAKVYELLKGIRTAGQEMAPSIIEERCIYLMINEAARCLEDGVVRQPGDIDVGMIFGTGFPPFRGGLLHYADSIGLDKIAHSLDQYAAQFGDRFKPADKIIEMAKAGSGFYNSPAPNHS